MQNRQKPIKQQKGAALILMAFIIGLAVIAYLLHTLDPARLRAEQDKKTMQTLNEAKQALIAWSVSHPNTPGLMPYPDRNNDGNYDDTSDCYANNVNFAPNFTLGRLPLFQNDPNCVNAKNTVNTGLEDDFRDGAGERLWYEASSNLLHDYKNNGGNPNGTSPIINPSIINSPTKPWFIVRDRSGAVISDRVAAVIIAPGSPSGIQDRSGGIKNADAYLDKIVMADGTPYKNYTYYDPAVSLLAQEFIIGDDYGAVAKNDPTYKDQSVEPYYYNDKLVYITIDELMAAIEKRVGEEVRAKLIDYATLNSGKYPYAAGLNLAIVTNQAIKGNVSGLLPTVPVNATNYTCICTNTKSCTCHFAGLTSVEYTRTGGSAYGFSGAGVPTGACTVDATHKTCRCYGAGVCKSSSGLSTQFTCDACGVCASTVNGSFTFIPKGSFSLPTNGCSSSGGKINCSSTSAGSFNVDKSTENEFSVSAPLPAWFKANNWQDYVYYEMTRPTNMTGITVGTKAAGAIVAAAGRPINSAPFAVKGSAQVRPSCDVSDYLDSAENISANSVYDSTSKQRASNYNDQAFVVSP
jgi:hypothetical protein